MKIPAHCNGRSLWEEIKCLFIPSIPICFTSHTSFIPFVVERWLLPSNFETHSVRWKSLCNYRNYSTKIRYLQLQLNGDPESLALGKRIVLCLGLKLVFILSKYFISQDELYMRWKNFHYTLASELAVEEMKNISFCARALHSAFE